MPHALQRAWLDRTALSGVLLPLSWVYALAVATRRACYRLRLLRSTRVDVPVIVVGNVVAGGAGKTPVVLALLAHLKSRGLRPGVVSRGYGRRDRRLLEVAPDSRAETVGDEPLLLRQRGDVPVVVAARRADAARALLQRHPDTDVIICDDGLQHLALQRDIEICVFDERGAGNGRLLPAGPLREAWPRPVDLVLRHPDAPLQGHVVRRSLAANAIDARSRQTSLAGLRGPRVVALAGIAHPERFFAMLAAAGVVPRVCLALPDHHPFATLPPGIEPDDVLVCTEKDAAKLWRLRPDAWAVALHVEVQPAFWQALDRLLDVLPPARLSSPDGPEAA